MGCFLFHLVNKLHICGQLVHNKSHHDSTCQMHISRITRSSIMCRKMTIYHGSKDIIKEPIYGRGNPHNDYGLGFYCTEHLSLAKEWACDDKYGGYANKYELDVTDLKILDLSGKDYCILHWISILLQNRQMTLESDISAAAKEYILKNFPVDPSGYDVIRGYRADDSYFSYARDFLHGSIPIRCLSQAISPSNLGDQIVLISIKAFRRIHFVGFEEAPQNVYFPLRKKRDELTRMAYLSDEKSCVILPHDIFMLDIMRNEMKTNDPRLQ